MAVATKKVLYLTTGASRWTRVSHPPVEITHNFFFNLDIFEHFDEPRRRYITNAHSINFVLP